MRPADTLPGRRWRQEAPACLWVPDPPPGPGGLWTPAWRNPPESVVTVRGIFLDVPWTAGLEARVDLPGVPPVTVRIPSLKPTEATLRATFRAGIDAVLGCRTHRDVVYLYRPEEDAAVSLGLADVVVEASA